MRQLLLFLLFVFALASSLAQDFLDGRQLESFYYKPGVLKVGRGAVNELSSPVNVHVVDENHQVLWRSLVSSGDFAPVPLAPSTANQSLSSAQILIGKGRSRLDYIGASFETLVLEFPRRGSAVPGGLRSLAVGDTNLFEAASLMGTSPKGSPEFSRATLTGASAFAVHDGACVYSTGGVARARLYKVAPDVDGPLGSIYARDLASTALDRNGLPETLNTGANVYQFLFFSVPPGGLPDDLLLDFGGFFFRDRLIVFGGGRSAVSPTQETVLGLDSLFVFEKGEPIKPGSSCHQLRQVDPPPSLPSNKTMLLSGGPMMAHVFAWPDRRRFAVVGGGLRNPVFSTSLFSNWVDDKGFDIFEEDASTNFFPQRIVSRRVLVPGCFFQAAAYTFYANGGAGLGFSVGGLEYELGLNGKRPTTSFCSLDSDGNVRSGELGEARAYAAVAPVGQWVVVFGGLRALQALDSVEFINPVDMTSSVLADHKLPVPIGGHVAIPLAVPDLQPQSGAAAAGRQAVLLIGGRQSTSTLSYQLTRGFETGATLWTMRQARDWLPDSIAASPQPPTGDGQKMMLAGAGPGGSNSIHIVIGVSAGVCCLLVVILAAIATACVIRRRRRRSAGDRRRRAESAGTADTGLRRIRGGTGGGTRSPSRRVSATMAGRRNSSRYSAQFRRRDLSEYEEFPAVPNASLSGRPVAHSIGAPAGGALSAAAVPITQGYSSGQGYASGSQYGADGPSQFIVGSYSSSQEPPKMYSTQGYSSSAAGGGGGGSQDSPQSYTTQGYASSSVTVTTGEAPKYTTQGYSAGVQQQSSNRLSSRSSLQFGVPSHTRRTSARHSSHPVVGFYTTSSSS